jgi:hypothetical protein
MDPFDAQPTPPRRGRRDNGLGADRYVPLLDVDPRVGEHLLDVLRLAGVPAYLEPSMDVEPYTRATSIPSPPTDRLWVDRERRDTARDIITAETSTGGRPDPADAEDAPSRGLTDLEEELAWREIISRYDRDFASRGGVPPWPVSEDLDRPRAPEAVPRPDRTDRPAAEQDAAAKADAHAPAEPASADAEEHFVPPVPPPMPRLSKQAILALLLIAVGVLLLVWPQVIGFSGQSGLALGVVALVSAGGLLVLRLREDRYDDPDDGAVL